ncbi:MAG: type I 3-dehydroquinate dehydratase [Methanothrix sp.]|jgi:3-dehydroquinate dehydratase, type I|uniref:3-dehydroquinate dehydratase n=1 Tax=Methanothrix thermoacetophila (strain DSM 6194 / JCM 14653 / NBRC 101360 / PT) TaxID=349307 RepID=AROD_METTP|nr:MULTISPECIES: type I 3-dehydroquinate dehydratase [Methanothrix]A0B6K7.1 RecName: Full=3-dehydroquinate dehydratase; Short=3-dehydroquinase; AltName: Full=Type I DHQase; AltName: Full=Type I dehydroquinase; Short=DHQ1 [Methanothrix thermoacetophila PT]ABK14331.1 3-dehydroquinate dehydratase [Methanothrix thermoacetophila PT]MBC7080323.1 type I 3-dehydroquinate dehydratase [Methanothrix sp.]NPU87644.1 type I 3-dehydroquinate dehydratase [Methanothrix sp.]
MCLRELDLNGLRIKTPAIVASLGADAERVASRAESEGADIIEVRLDLLADPDVIRDIRSTVSLPLIATNRIASEGGSFRGSEERRISILRDASRFSDIIDIELMAPGRDMLLKNISCPALISYHDFSGVPDNLKSIIEDAMRAGADLVKIAVTPHSMQEALAILRILLDVDCPLCIIGMGAVGRHLRAVAPLYGSLLTYGYVTGPTAPGQMSVRELDTALRCLGAR